MPLRNGVDIPNFVDCTIYGTYKITGVLGSGSYGVVYRAIDITSSAGTQYALKCVPKGEPRSRYARVLARERALHSSVHNHPGVVTLHKLIEFGEYVFLVFDLCGGSMASLISQDRAYYRNDALIKISILQIIDAVEHCHAQGVAHRDLKPENILRSEDGLHLFLADFGLATSRIMISVSSPGTRRYMSPEAIGKEMKRIRVTNRSTDVWSLGIILVNMVTGRNPWNSATLDDDCFRSFLHNPQFLLSVLPISKELNRLLCRIFNFNPFGRISLTRLRAEIVAMRTFFMTYDDIEQSTDWVRANDLAYSNQGPVRLPAGLPHFTVYQESIGAGRRDDDFSVVYFESDQGRMPEKADERARCPTKPVLLNTRAPSPNNGVTTRASSSVVASLGPITPSHPIIDGVGIAAVPQSLGDLNTSPFPVPGRLPVPGNTNVTKRPVGPRPKHIQNFIRRLKA